MKTNFLKGMLMIVTLAIFFASCKKTDSMKLPSGAIASTQIRNLKILMTGGYADMQSVVVDLQKIEVKEANANGNLTLDQILANDKNDDDAISSSDEFGQWKTLNIQPQSIDITSLRNGLEKLLGNATLDNRAIKLRLTFGDGSYVVDSLGNQSPLTFADPADQVVYAVLYDNVLDLDQSPADAIVHLNFDVYNSLTDNNGTMQIKPRIQPFSTNAFGEVSGVINPSGVQAKITLTDITGATTVTVNEADGTFRFKGLKPGSGYSLSFDAAGYAETTISNLEIVKGRSTDVGDVVIQ